ncbi:hypothetical protein HDU87_007223 [Geranomyces variabilis]|uniref:Uncharacterized protein n=1 Tax=Geranomyces variabilis TaxID=109894 RepID=A0AAD5TFV1_9FUNG|nr:hypothetical protein HDU87_007223 [Geranomyces variabilis]
MALPATVPGVSPTVLAPTSTTEASFLFLASSGAIPTTSTSITGNVSATRTGSISTSQSYYATPVPTTPVPTPYTNRNYTDPATNITYQSDGPCDDANGFYCACACNGEFLMPLLYQNYDITFWNGCTLQSCQAYYYGQPEFGIPPKRAVCSTPLTVINGDPQWGITIFLGVVGVLALALACPFLTRPRKNKQQERRLAAAATTAPQTVPVAHRNAITTTKQDFEGMAEIIEFVH